jgi:hypothetical protein
MPDYASILRRSVAALNDASPPMREAVYQRARAALARQLTAVDPPLSTREIERQHQELEDAVARLEADFSAEDADEPEPEPVEDEYFEPEPPEREPSYPAQAREDRSHEVARDYDGEEDEGGEEDDEFEDEERSSRAPLLIGLAVLAAVIAGAGFYVYAQRDRLSGVFAQSGSEEVAEPADERPAPIVMPEEPPPAEEVAASPDKRPDRMTNGTEPPPARDATPEPAPVAEAPLEPAPEEPAAPLEIPAEEPPTETALPAEPPEPEQQTAALAQPGESLVAQRAIFYFQGKEGTAGQATEGTVTWAEITKDDRPAIQATLRLTDQPATTTVTISKNADASLPASHLVEVQFSGELGPSPIQRVPALVMKQTEQARGQPLTGAAVPVTNELFWIALSDNQEQVAQNIQLLREGSWFDIPILYNDGTRALLSFEKGIPGDKVFETVMSSWTPS